MKRLLMCGLVLAVMLFLGLNTYYFIRNSENIELTVQAGGAIYINEGDKISVPINHTKPYKATEITVKSANTNVVELDGDMKNIVARGAGSSQITVTTTNKNFGPFSFDVYVGTGENENSPLYINTAAELAQIGVKEGWTMSRFYRVTSDIDLASYNGGEWKPIGSIYEPFGGSFDGNQKTIKNLKITTNYDAAGLFAATASSASVEGVVLENVNIDGSFYYAGSIVGLNKGTIGLSKVEGVNISSINERNDVSVGGIAGSNVFDGKYPQINMCEAFVSNIRGFSYIGGLVGTNSSGIIINSYAKVLNAEILGGGFGGLVGLNNTVGSNKSVIEKSYSVIEKVIGSGSKGALIGVNNASKILSEGALFFSLSEVQHAVGSGNEFDKAVKEVSIDRLGYKETYTNITDTWNFNSVWKIDSVARVDFDGVYEPYLGIFTEGSDITAAETLLSALEEMQSNPENEIVYAVSANITLDLGGRLWNPIGNDDHPFKGSLITKGNVKVVIKNFRVEGQKYGGLFGLVNGEGNVIAGITIEDAVISNSYYAGSIVAANYSATIQNCNVNNVTIENATYLGGAVGYNSAVVKGLNINNVDRFVRTIVKSANREILGVGGAVGINQKSGLVEDVVIYDTKVSASSATGSKTAVGGIVGENHGTISSSFAVAEIEVSTQNNAYVGGVVGDTAEGLVKLCYSTSVIEAGTVYKNTLVGGVAGNVGSGARVELSFFEGMATGYKAGGIAGLANGTISQCYVTGSIAGIEVGGLAHTTGGSIVNSYSKGSVEGSKEVAGFTVRLPRGGQIDYCYNSLNYGGSAKYKYAETVDNFRDWLNWTKPFGTISNCVVVTSGEVELYVQVVWNIIFKIGKGGYIEATPSEGKGEVGDFSKFKKDAGFATSVWGFDIGNEPYISGIPSIHEEEDLF